MQFQQSYYDSSRPKFSAQDFQIYARNARKQVPLNQWYTIWAVCYKSVKDVWHSLYELDKWPITGCMLAGLALTDWQQP